MPLNVARVSFLPKPSFFPRLESAAVELLSVIGAVCLVVDRAASCGSCVRR